MKSQIPQPKNNMPREKLIHKGRESLSDPELVALLLGSGVKGKSALHIAESLLNGVEQDLNRLACLNYRELMRIKGVGEAKAIALIAALELGRRKREAFPGALPHIACSRDAYENLSPMLTNLSQEEFWVLLLNRANKVLAKSRISMGGLSGTLVDPKLVFKTALENKASALVLAHNHPSGNPKPSEADLKLTIKIKNAADLLDITVLDHLIFTDTGYYSMADSGVL